MFLLNTLYREQYVSELNEGMDGNEVRLAGWVHEVRDIGKLLFLIPRDRNRLTP